MAYMTIPSLFTGICDAIRNKSGIVGNISHQEIPNAIMNINNGGGGGGVSCDLGLIYIDPDPASPDPVSYTNEFSPRAYVYCSDNVYSMDYAFSWHYSNFNIYPNCGNNVTSMEEAYSSCEQIIGSPVIGSNVEHMPGAYANCQNLFGSVNIPLGHYININNAFYDCQNLSGSVFIGGGYGEYVFYDCYNIISAEISDWNGSYSIFQEYFSYCSNLHDIIFNKQNVLNPQVSPSTNNIFDSSYNYYNCFMAAGKALNGNTSTSASYLNIYVYNEDDYNFIKTNGFLDKKMFGYGDRQRTFGSDIIPSESLIINVPWNMYENNVWNNTNKEMNINKYCSSPNTSTSQIVNLYYVN